MVASTSHPSNAWEFNAAGFARTIAARRAELGLSTREVSRRAAISQAYVVALERARVDDGQRTPTPTVDVLARLAEALETAPDHLLRLAIRRTGQHVLLLVDGDDRRSPLAAAQRVTGDDIDWVWASSSAADHRADRLAHHHIDLRRTRTSAYEPTAIARSLRTELEGLVADIEGCQLGIVFAETSAVMASLDDPNVIIEFEHAWDDVVTDAAHHAGAHAAWNICVYELPAVQGLPEPVTAMADLMRSHDTVWYSRRTTVLTGASAALGAFERLRPEGVRRADWDVTARAIVAELGYAA